MLRRINLSAALGGAVDRQGNAPWVCDCRTFDIPNTIASLIRYLPASAVAVSLRPEGGAAMVAVAEREARRRGMRVLWVPLRQPHGSGRNGADMSGSRAARRKER